MIVHLVTLMIVHLVTLMIVHLVTPIHVAEQQEAHCNSLSDKLL